MNDRERAMLSAMQQNAMPAPDCQRLESRLYELENTVERLRAWVSIAFGVVAAGFVWVIMLILRHQ